MNRQTMSWWEELISWWREVRRGGYLAVKLACSSGLMSQTSFSRRCIARSLFCATLRLMSSIFWRVASSILASMSLREPRIYSHITSTRYTVLSWDRRTDGWTDSQTDTLQLMSSIFWSVTSSIFASMSLCEPRICSSTQLGHTPRARFTYTVLRFVARRHKIILRQKLSCGKTISWHILRQSLNSQKLY